MNALFFALFNQDPDEYSIGLGSMSPQDQERALILGAIAVVVILALCWAAFFRKKPRNRRGHIKRNRHSFFKSLKEGFVDLQRIFAQRQRERKRIHHRPRNPTRAEVGGLPASRSESEDGSEPRTGN